MLQDNKGFTLVEMVVVISLLGIVAIIATGFLLTTLSGSGKAEMVKEVRQNGNYALSVMENMIRNSLAFKTDCPNPDNKSLTIVNQDGGTTVFSCSEGKIASGSAFLTNDSVFVDDEGEDACSFECTHLPGLPPVVTIKFTVSQIPDESLRPSEKASLDFETVVVVRNY